MWVGAELDRFVGREAELAAVAARFGAGERLVTVVGPPGIGKTRFALRHVARVSRLAVTLCDLDGARTADEVVARVASALAANAHGAAGPASEGRRRDAAFALEQALCALGPNLLVLDNAEGVAEVARSLVAGWLAAAPETTVLATSRVRLAIPGEIVFELGPLSADAELGAPAVELLVDRIGRVRGGAFVPTDVERRALLEIARYVDGIPLALELCAARSRVLSLSELAARTARGSGAIDGGGGREGTLHRAVDGSWELLDEPTRTLFASCGLFRGGFSVDDAEAIFGGDVAQASGASVLDGLQTLRDHSLLHLDAGPAQRLRMLASLRQYAIERFAGLTCRQAIERSWAVHYVELAERLARDAVRPGGDDALARLCGEHDNLIGAVELALYDLGDVTLALRGLCALAPAAPVLGATDAALAHLDAALAAPANADASLLARAWQLRGRFRYVRTVDDAADADFERAGELAVAAGDAVLEGNVLCDRGMLLLTQGRLDDAAVLFRRACACHERAGDLRAQATGFLRLAYVELERGRVAVARPLLERSAALSELNGSPADLLFVAFAQAVCDHDAGELDAARAAYARLAERARAVGSRLIEHAAVLEEGVVHHQRGQLERALELVTRAAEGLRGSDDRFYGIALAERGAVLAESGRLGEAEIAFEGARRVFVAARLPRLSTMLRVLEGSADVSRAARASDEGDAGAAARHLAKARHRLDEARADGGEAASLDVRFAVRALERALAAAEPAAAVLRVDIEGRWFEVPSSARVSCERRAPLRLLLAALARQRVEAPGASLSAAELVSTAWPGERIRVDAAKNRLHVALSTLRRLGLRELFQATADGYRLDPGVVVRVVAPSS